METSSAACANSIQPRKSPPKFPVQIAVELVTPEAVVMVQIRTMVQINPEIYWKFNGARVATATLRSTQVFFYIVVVPQRDCSPPYLSKFDTSFEFLILIYRIIRIQIFRSSLGK